MISLLFPEGFVVLLGIFLLMVESFVPGQNKRTLGWLAITGLFLILGLTFFMKLGGGVNADFYVVDSVALFFKRFILVSAILTIALALDFAPVFAKYLPSASPNAGLGEFLTLPVFTAAGLMWMVSAADFIMIFVSLELVTISFYVLVPSMRKNLGSLEAGVKYLILGALSTGFLVYGITWIFGMTGATTLRQIATQLPVMPEASQTALLFGLGLVLVGLGFKIAAVPFQFWVADVYQGAPTPVTAYLSVASKAAGFVVLLRVLEPFFIVPAFAAKLGVLLTVLAAATLIYGNLAAMPQTNLKRLLAYSSIAHAGYLLIGVASIDSGMAGVAIAFYLTGYLFMTFLAFIVVVLVSRTTGGDDISDFNGLNKRSPLLAISLLLSMLSLAGLPFTVGFFGKFFIFEAAMASHQYLLVVLGMVTVACGFYYYLKVVRAMYWQPAPDHAEVIAVPGFSKLLIGVLSLAILVFGFFPKPLLALLE